MKHIKLLSTLFILFFSQIALADSEIKQIVNSIQEKNWNLATKVAESSKIEILKSLVKWQIYLDYDNKEKKFEDIINFIKTHKNWPCTNILKEAAENSINENTSKKELYMWFLKNKPVTPKGNKYRAYIFARYVNDEKKLSNYIKYGWIYGQFDKNEQKNYLNRFSKYLSASDHYKRADHLLWNNDTENAELLLKYFRPETQEMFKMRINSQNNKVDHEAIYTKLDPKYKNNSGLLYDFAYSARKQDKINNFLTKIVMKGVKDETHSTSWWKLKSYFIRELIKQKKYKDAYKIASHHNCNESVGISEGEWLSGWIAFRFLNSPKKALDHFIKLYHVVNKPISKSRGAYWIGRTYKILGEDILAKKFYKKAAKYSFTYYGMLAHHELKIKKIVIPQAPVIFKEILEKFKDNEFVKLSRQIALYDEKLALLFAKSLLSKETDKYELAALVEALIITEFPHYSLEIARAASNKKTYFKRHLFPVPFNIKPDFIKNEHAYAVIRYESAFDQYVVNEANDSGLMQLIPSTACSTSLSLNLKCDLNKLTKDRDYNILLGTKHLKDLQDEFKNYLVFSTAAYNAGKDKVNKWIKTYGNPQKMDLYDIIDWIELIPFEHTRSYVQRILENIQVYRIILTQDNNLFIIDALKKR